MNFGQLVVQETKFRDWRSAINCHKCSCSLQYLMKSRKPGFIILLSGLQKITGGNVSEPFKPAAGSSKQLMQFISIPSCLSFQRFQEKTHPYPLFFLKEIMFWQAAVKYQMCCWSHTRLGGSSFSDSLYKFPSRCCCHSVHVHCFQSGDIVDHIKDKMPPAFL